MDQMSDNGAMLHAICQKYNLSIEQASKLSDQYNCVVFTQAFNEEHNVKEFLDNIYQFADGLVILDDGSTDGTSKALKEENILLHLKRQENSGFNDYENRCILFELAGLVNTKWLLFLDLDERLELRYKNSFRWLLKSQTAEHIRFRYVHAWNSREKFRKDYPYSENGVQYRLKMIRKKENMQLDFKKVLHFELEPYKTQRVLYSHVLIVHLGNENEEVRQKRYLNYKKVDPEQKGQGSYEHLVSKNVELRKINELYEGNWKLQLKFFLEYYLKLFSAIFGKRKTNHV